MTDQEKIIKRLQRLGNAITLASEELAELQREVGRQAPSSPGKRKSIRKERENYYATIVRTGIKAKKRKAA